MPIAFVDPKLIEAFSELDDDKETVESVFPAHAFEASCLKAGFSTKDLEERTYVSIMKVLFSFIDKRKKEIRNATQKDIDKFMS